MNIIFQIILIALVVIGFVTGAIYLAVKNAVDYPDYFDDNPIYTKFHYEQENKEVK